MEIYVTSKNDGPTMVAERTYVRYIGISLDEAIKAVGEFVKYQHDEKIGEKRYANLYTAAPDEASPEFVHFYEADGWWYSIVKVVV